MSLSPGRHQSSVRWRFWTIWLFLWIAVIGCGHGYKFKPGKCASIANTQDNFKINKFMGTWHVVQGSNVASRCYSLTFVDEGDGAYSMEVNKQLYSLRAAGIVHNFHFKAQLYPKNNKPAVMVLRLPSSSYSDIFYEVVTTNYDDYALLWSCKSTMFGHLESALVLSRKPTLELEALTAMRDFLQDIGVDITEMSSVQQTSCNPELGGGFFTLEMAKGLATTEIDWKALIQPVPGLDPGGCFIELEDDFIYQAPCPTSGNVVDIPVSGITDGTDEYEYEYEYYYEGDEDYETDAAEQTGSSTKLPFANTDDDSEDESETDEYSEYYYEYDCSSEEYYYEECEDNSGDYYGSGEYYEYEYSGDYEYERSLPRTKRAIKVNGAFNRHNKLIKKGLEFQNIDSIIDEKTIILRKERSPNDKQKSKVIKSSRALKIKKGNKNKKGKKNNKTNKGTSAMKKKSKTKKIKRKNKEFKSLIPHLIMISPKLQRFLINHNVDVTKIPKKLKFSDIESYFGNKKDKKTLLKLLSSARNKWKVFDKVKKLRNKGMKVKFSKRIKKKNERKKRRKRKRKGKKKKNKKNGRPKGKRKKKIKKKKKSKKSNNPHNKHNGDKNQLILEPKLEEIKLNTNNKGNEDKRIKERIKKRKRKRKNKRSKRKRKDEEKKL